MGNKMGRMWLAIVIVRRRIQPRAIVIQIERMGIAIGPGGIPGIDIVYAIKAIGTAIVVGHGHTMRVRMRSMGVFECKERGGIVCGECISASSLS